MLKQEVEDGQASLADPQFRHDVVTGLALRPRAIPARWLYDRAGSELFEQITDLPEYYPTRTEIAILADCRADLARRVPAGAAVVEFGSGSSTKTPALIESVQPAAYVPIDISGDFLRDSAAVVQRQFPDVQVLPLEGDFTRPLTLPAAVVDLPKLGFFPGSTIGNMLAAGAVDLLRSMRASLGEGAMLLIGIDRIKPVDVLVRAYDDAAGVTAAFNLNLLTRINRELAGTIPLDAFRHRAIWNDDRARIEMHLEAVRDVAFEVEGRPFEMAAGETIHTENSHKYGPRDARLLLRGGGWTPVAEWTDPDDRFALILAEAQAERRAP
ncbi:L-histidine N(alpha)-methyltransferase [Sphingomonas sp. RS2018]